MPEPSEEPQEDALKEEDEAVPEKEKKMTHKEKKKLKKEVISEFITDSECPVTNRNVLQFKFVFLAGGVRETHGCPSEEGRSRSQRT